jgi:hypothetical protein
VIRYLIVFELSGPGRDSRAAGVQRPELADPDREASRRSVAGPFLRASRAKLRKIGERLGVRRLVNVRGCPIRWQRTESWFAAVAAR